MGKTRSRRAIWRTIIGIATVAFVVGVIWLDVATGLWAETVILSGIAAGLVTFLLTALFVERWLARREQIKWLPVTRVAITDLLHAISDPNQSDLHRHHIVPRAIPLPDTQEDAEKLLSRVHDERRDLADALARWLTFLAESADVQKLMNEIAQLAQQLDAIRDEVTEGAESLPEVRREVRSFNEASQRAVDEMLQLLDNIEQTTE